MKIDIVKATPPNKLNPTDVSQHVPLSGAHVELGATATLHEIANRASKEDVRKFLSTCKTFLIENIFFKFKVDSICSSPGNCSMSSTLQCCCSQTTFLKSICQKLPYLKDTGTIDLDKLDMEWRLHAPETKAKPELHWDWSFGLLTPA